MSIATELENDSRPDEEPAPQARPAALTLIGWFLVTTASVSLVAAGILALGLGGPEIPEVALTVMVSSLIPIPLLYVVLIIEPMVHLAAGVGLLVARKWARWLYVGSSIAFLAVTFLDPWLRTTVIPGVMWLLVLSFFLFRDDANAYFREQPAAHKLGA